MQACPAHLDSDVNTLAEQQELGRCWRCGNAMTVELPDPEPSSPE